MQQIVREMGNHAIDVLGYCIECRWTGSGKIKLNIAERQCYTRGWRVHTNEECMAVIIARRHKQSLPEWEPVNERIIRARFYLKQIKLAVIRCYAPTIEASEDEKVSFLDYRALHDTTSKVLEHNMFVL